MANAIFSSDSDSDMEVLMEIFDSENEEERNQRRGSASRKYKRVNYMHTECLNDAEFTFRFRINKAAVEILLTEIMPFVKVTSKRNNGVSPLHQLLLTLRFYALGTMLISVADFIGVSKSSASNIVRDMSLAIARLYNKYVVMHQDSVQKFYRIAQFPRGLGCIDCTHVRIQSPCNIIGEEFRNRKGYFSLNVQAVCDANLKFMNVVARWPGSAHDATIHIPSLCLRVVLRTFGVWKRRFPVVGLPLRLSLQNSQAVIIATAVLHNICRNYNIEEIPPEVDLPATNDIDLHAPNGLEDIQQRTELIHQYFV